MESILQTQVLVGRIHDGNKEALNQLCERYMPRILYAVRARLGMRLRRKVQSMDVLQDAMVDIVKGIDNFEFRSDGAFLHYVNRIIENNIRDEAAKFQAAKRDIAKEQEAVVSDKEGFKQLDVEDYRVAATPSLQVSQIEDMQRLEKAMDLLYEESPEYHELIVKTKLEGFTYVELSEQYETSADAIRMKVNRARESLKKHFSEQV